MPALVNADEVILQSENMRKLYISKLTGWLGEGTKYIWEQKIVSSKTQTAEKSDDNNDDGSDNDKEIKNPDNKTDDDNNGEGDKGNKGENSKGKGGKKKWIKMK